MHGKAQEKGIVFLGFVTSLYAFKAPSSVADVYLALRASFKKQCKGEIPG